MKEYTVRYNMNGYWYESKVCTTSSDAALYWAMRWSEDADKRFIADWGSRFPNDAGDVLFGVK